MILLWHHPTACDKNNKLDVPIHFNCSWCLIFGRLENGKKVLGSIWGSLKLWTPIGIQFIIIALKFMLKYEQRRTKVYKFYGTEANCSHVQCPFYKVFLWCTLYNCMTFRVIFFFSLFLEDEWIYCYSVIVIVNILVIICPPKKKKKKKKKIIFHSVHFTPY